MHDIPVVRQDVFFHIWGMAGKSEIDELRRHLRGFERSIQVPINVEEAMTPGGTRIRDVVWGDMPSGIPHILRFYGFSMAWLTAPVGDEVRGSHLSHAGLCLHLEVRCNPVRTACDLPRVYCDLNEGAEDVATTLLGLSQALGVRGALSAHQAIYSIPTLRAAHCATSIADLHAVGRSSLTHQL